MIDLKMHKRIRTYIEENGWSIKFIAHKIGIKESRFYRLMNGVAPLTTEEYETICNGLGLDPDYFFKDFFLEIKNKDQSAKEVI